MPKASFLHLSLLALLAASCGQQPATPVQVAAAQAPTQASRHAPSSEARAAFERSRELFAKEDPLAAIAAMERAVELAPDWAEAHLALGKLAVTYSEVRFSTATVDRGRLEKAIGELERACALDPRSAEAAFWAGHALLKADRSEEAARRLETALTLKPEHGQAAKDLGLLYAGEGDPKRSIEYLNRARALLPKDDEVLFQLGLQLESEERLEEARDAYLGAAELNTGHPGPRSRLIWIYRRLGDQAASERMAKEFERCRAFGKRMTAASLHFDANSHDPAACMGIAELYREIGMHAPAIQWAERALRLDPKHEPALELLRKLGKPVEEPEQPDDYPDGYQIPPGYGTGPQKER